MHDFFKWCKTSACVFVFNMKSMEMNTNFKNLQMFETGMIVPN